MDPWSRNKSMGLGNRESRFPGPLRKSVGPGEPYADWDHSFLSVRREGRVDDLIALGSRATQRSRFPWQPLGCKSPWLGDNCFRGRGEDGGLPLRDR